MEDNIDREALLGVYQSRCRDLQDSLIMQQAQSVTLLRRNKELEKENSELRIELENLQVRLSTLENSEN